MRENTAKSSAKSKELICVLNNSEYSFSSDCVLCLSNRIGKSFINKLKKIVLKISPCLSPVWFLSDWVGIGSRTESLISVRRRSDKGLNPVLRDTESNLIAKCRFQMLTLSPLYCDLYFLYMLYLLPVYISCYVSYFSPTIEKY